MGGAVVSCVGECFRACGRWSCYYCLSSNSSILVSPLYNRPALAKFEYETTHPYAAVYSCSMVGGLVGGWMTWPVGGCLVRYRGWCLVGDLEADVVLVGLCCELLTFVAAKRLCCAVGVCYSRIKLR